ncbi:MAG: hypothetical protein HXY47_05055 [Nitrospirae bacterium]|nr:hypothetical protein [Nitrospirota bacterium]
MRKKSFIGILSFIVLQFGLFLLPNDGYSDVDFFIGIGTVPPPPAVIIPAPPAVYLIPGTSVYFAPYVDFELFFHSDYWYRIHDGYWYKAFHHNGPWYYLPYSRVPVVFKQINYYRFYEKKRHIPYGHFRTHCRKGIRDIIRIRGY